MYKLAKLEIQNFRKLTAVNIDVSGNIIEVSGKNSSGKTSTLNAPWVLLKGASVAPTTPIHEGAERAVIKGIFKGKDVDLIATRTFTKSDRDPRGWTTKLEVTNGEGLTSKIPPQQQLDAIIGEHRLDPIEFINLSPPEQLKAFRAFIPDVDFDLLEEQNDVDYKKRTEIGRDVEKFNGAAAAISVPDMTPEVEVDVNALAAELQDAGKHNTDIETRKAKRKEVATQVESLRKNYLDNLQRVAELEKQVESIKEMMTQSRTEADALQAKLDTAPELPAPKSTTLITQRIQDANSININVRAKQSKAKYLEQAKHAQDMYDAVTNEMNKRKAHMELAVKNAKLPLPNIGFGKTALLLNGLPFKEASTAEQIRTAVALSMSLHPQLRLMWIRDASLLDDDSLATIYALAEEYDCNVLLETVRPQSGSAIVLVDGHVDGVEVQPMIVAQDAKRDSIAVGAIHGLSKEHDVVTDDPERTIVNDALEKLGSAHLTVHNTAPPTSDDDIL